LLANDLDGVVIAVPPEHHLPILERVIDRGITLIWCEKPLALTRSDGQTMRTLVETHDVTFAVNFLRRWSPMIDDLREWLTDAGLGRPRTVTVLYGKGLSNTASHIVDLLHALWGRPVRCSRGRALDSSDDPTLDGVLTYVVDDYEVDVALRGVPHDAYQLLEIDFVFDRGRVRVEDGGRTTTRFAPRPDPDFPGYVRLVPSERREGRLDAMFERALDQVVDAWMGVDERPLAAIDDALDVLAVVDALRHTDPVGTVIEWD
jgi:predicted dehydrogenase